MITHMYSWAIRFKRTATGEKSTGWEDGIAIGANPDTIMLVIDSNFKVVINPYQLFDVYYNGCFHIEAVKP